MPLILVAVAVLACAVPARRAASIDPMMALRQEQAQEYRRTAGEKPDGVELLEREHRRFEELLKQSEETTERPRATRRELLETLTRELNAHELMAEKVRYPALQAHPQAREVVLEGFEEHHVADLIVRELHEIATTEEAWGPKFKVLKENIEHHIKEEEGDMFRLARGLFTREARYTRGSK